MTHSVGLIQGGLMGNEEPPGGPRTLPAPIRLRSSDPRDPPDHLSNAIPIPDSPVTDTPDALPSDSTMSLEIEVAQKAEVEPDVPVIVLMTGDRSEDARQAGLRAAAEQAAADKAREQERLDRRANVDLKVVNEWVPEYEEHDLKTLEGQVRLIQESLGRLVNVSEAPYLGVDGGPQVQRIVAEAPSRLEGRDLAVITRVLLGNLEPNPELLGYVIVRYQNAHQFENLQSEVVLRQLAAEVNAPQVPDLDDSELDGDDLEDVPPPTAEDMAPYLVLIPEITPPEEASAFDSYATVHDLVSGVFPEGELDNEARAEAIADVALALSGVRIDLQSFERSVARLRGEDVTGGKPASIGARFPVAESGPLLSHEEVDPLNEALRDQDPTEWEIKDDRSDGLFPTAPPKRSRSGSMGRAGRMPIPGKAEVAPAVRKVKREQLVPASALWSLTALLVLLGLAITAFLLREDTLDRNASLSRDQGLDAELSKQSERLRQYGETLAGAIAEHTEKDAKIVILTRERDGYESLATQAVTVVDDLRDDVGNLERDTRRRVSSIASDLSATQREIRALRTDMQGSQSRERDLKARVEATESYATSMVNTQKCPVKGTGTLTSGQAGTIFECRQSGAKAFAICIGSDPATAHSCQMTTAPK
ncbi:MAG: hypothetical protein HQ488_01795 [Parcubacteria group bacterium]|nr:hypothetical protein [Parcubacteria group bacterium]